MASNAVLNRKAEEDMQVARLLAGLTDRTEHVYGEVRYAAGSWSKSAASLSKPKSCAPKIKRRRITRRFVVTNMNQTPQWLYEEVYCQRGEIENLIKEVHAMEIDRTSCSRFWANQFRVLLTAAAYVLMQELRLAAAGSNCARAQVWTLRERFLKLRARVMVSVRRMVVHLPQSFPFLATFQHMALELGASPG
jgi:Transposase DDE domain group 1